MTKTHKIVLEVLGGEIVFKEKLSLDVHVMLV